MSCSATGDNVVLLAESRIDIHLRTGTAAFWPGLASGLAARRRMSGDLCGPSSRRPPAHGGVGSRFGRLSLAHAYRDALSGEGHSKSRGDQSIGSPLLLRVVRTNERGVPASAGSSDGARRSDPASTIMKWPKFPKKWRAAPLRTGKRRPRPIFCTTNRSQATFMSAP